jgi:hypothetical protein
VGATNSEGVTSFVGRTEKAPCETRSGLGYTDKPSKHMTKQQALGYTQTRYLEILTLNIWRHCQFKYRTINLPGGAHDPEGSCAQNKL